MKTWRRILIGQTVLVAAVSISQALNAAQSVETPQIVNAKIETRAVGGSLAEAFRGAQAQADKPEWIGYSVAEVAGDRTVCCGNFNDSYNGCGTCRLEKENGMTTTGSGKDAQTGTVQLEGSRQLVVLIRLENKQ